MWLKRTLLLFGSIVALLLLGAVGYWQYTVWVVNPRVERELLENPDGERAHRVMLLTLPSLRRIPVNYIVESGDEGTYAFAAADGTWWQELTGGPHEVSVLIRGAHRTGRARAVRDDPEYTAQIFSRLRPDALEGFGTLIEIELVEHRE